MTVAELRKLLEEEERKGHGDCEISVVSSNCQTIFPYDEKYTSDIEPYYDNLDGSFTITD